MEHELNKIGDTMNVLVSIYLAMYDAYSFKWSKHIMANHCVYYVLWWSQRKISSASSIGSILILLNIKIRIFYALKYVNARTFYQFPIWILWRSHFNMYICTFLPVVESLILHIWKPENSEKFLMYVR